MSVVNGHAHGFDLARAIGKTRPKLARKAIPVSAPAPVPAPPPPGRPVRRAVAKATVPAGVDHGAAFAQAFGALASVAAAVVPKRHSPRAKAAAAYWGASLANQAAEAWRSKAKAVCVAEGVLPDPASPSPIGTIETVYADATISIAMKVVAQADRVDVVALVADLTKAGVDPKVLKRLTKKHTRSFAGAHIFTASLV